MTGKYRGSDSSVSKCELSVGCCALWNEVVLNYPISHQTSASVRHLNKSIKHRTTANVQLTGQIPPRPSPGFVFAAEERGPSVISSAIRSINKFPFWSWHLYERNVCGHGCKCRDVSARPTPTGSPLRRQWLRGADLRSRLVSDSGAGHWLVVAFARRAAWHLHGRHVSGQPLLPRFISRSSSSEGLRLPRARHRSPRSHHSVGDAAGRQFYTSWAGDGVPRCSFAACLPESACFLRPF